MSVQTDGGCERILIVDDERSTREFLGEFLTKEGYRCAVAADGNVALQQLLDFRPHLIVSDVRMPGLSGVELLELVRQRSPATSVVLMTAYGTAEDAARAIKRGAADYLQKPLTLSKIREAVRKALTQPRTSVGEAAAEAPAPVRHIKQGSDKRSITLDELAGSLLALAGMRVDSIRAHGLRVAYVADHVAAGLSLAPVSREEIQIAARIHDVGKNGLDEAILKKREDALTPEELERFKTHALLSADVAASISGLNVITSYVRHHHERYDGAGYPDGLREVAIPLGARIIAVADEYDRLVEPEVGEKTTPGDAVQRVLAESGRAFDPRVCEVFARVVVT